MVLLESLWSTCTHFRRHRSGLRDDGDDDVRANLEEQQSKLHWLAGQVGAQDPGIPWVLPGAPPPSLSGVETPSTGVVAAPTWATHNLPAKSSSPSSSSPPTCQHSGPVPGMPWPLSLTAGFGMALVWPTWSACWTLFRRVLLPPYSLAPQKHQAF